MATVKLLNKEDGYDENGTIKDKSTIPKNLLSKEEGYDENGTVIKEVPSKKTCNRTAANILSAVAGWPYSEFDTFKDVIADEPRSGVGVDKGDIIEISVSNEPMLLVATAQVIRSVDKKVIIVSFRGTELVNVVNWITEST